MTAPTLSGERLSNYPQSEHGSGETRFREMPFGSRVWVLLKTSILGFIDDDALSRSASMAFFAVTSLAPILLIIVAVAGLVFGREAAQDALARELTGLMGEQSAETVQALVKSASDRSAGAIATIIGFVTLVITVSGVFGEMQNSLNAIWKVRLKSGTVSRLIRARAASMGLVAALGFLLIVSLAVSAAIAALGGIINSVLPFGAVILASVNALVSFLLVALLFAAIYKILPDLPLRWRDVWFGAFVTSALFSGGKLLIGLYISTSAVSSSYGAAGALIVILLWVYYSSVIFLFGAELTRAYSETRKAGSRMPLTTLPS